MSTSSHIHDPKGSSFSAVIYAGIEAMVRQLEKSFNKGKKAEIHIEPDTDMPKKWEKLSEYAGLVFNLILAGQYLWLWISPDANDVNKIFSLSTLILFEFVMVHSGVFMALMPVRFSMLIFIPFYGLFALGFSLVAKNITIIILYLVVVFNRMGFAFYNVEIKTRVALLIKSFFILMLYFLLIIILAIVGDFLPMFGLDYSFLLQSSYINVKSGASGLFIDTPHVAMCMGTLYYLLLTLLEYKLMKRDERTRV